MRQLRLRRTQTGWATNWWGSPAKRCRTSSPPVCISERARRHSQSNRRVKAPDGSTRIGVNRAGPVDHEVPVLKVQGADGKLKAVLFGYACHNTTLGGNNYKFAGDYAGYAQLEVEKANPGATAMFIALRGGDRNPQPNGAVQMARDHGAELAEAVDHALKGSMKSVHGPVRAAWMTTPLKYNLRTREELRTLEGGRNPQQGRYARAML